MQDRLEAEKSAAAERARNAEASSKALHEQQAQTGKALESVRRQMGEVSSKAAVDPRMKGELARLRKQVKSEEEQPTSDLLLLPVDWLCEGCLDGVCNLPHEQLPSH